MEVKGMAVPSEAPVTVHRGSFPTKHLIPGEKILWEGRPSRIVYFLRSFLMFIFGIAFSVLAFTLDTDDLGNGDLVSWAPLIAMLVLLALMVALHRRWGALEVVVGVAALVAVLAFDVTRWVVIAPALVGLLFFLVDYILWSHTYFGISDRRIMTQYGIFNLMFADTQIDRIQNVTVVQPILERILGYGDVMFATAGNMGGIVSDDPAENMRKGGAIVWENVPKPFEVRKISEEIINRVMTPQVYVAAPAYAPQVPLPPGAPAYAPVAPVPMTQPAAPPPATRVEAEERLTKLRELNQKGLITNEEYEQKKKEILGQM